MKGSTAFAVIAGHVIAPSASAQDAQLNGPATDEASIATDVRLDASLTVDTGIGTRIEGNGVTYTIDDANGLLSGGNRIHSFAEFDLGGADTLRFVSSGNAPIDNVISRVTGGDGSTINGTLQSTIQGADVYFINPQGVTFGSGAVVDVPAAFHVSTEPLNVGNAALNAAGLSDAGLSVELPRIEDFGIMGQRDATITLNGVEMARGTRFEAASATVVVSGRGLTATGTGTGSDAATRDAGSIRIAAGRLTIDDAENLDENLVADAGAFLDLGSASESLAAGGIVSAVDRDGSGSSGDIEIRVIGDAAGGTSLALNDGRIGTDVTGAGGGEVGNITIAIENGDLGSADDDEGSRRAIGITTAGNLTSSAGAVSIETMRGSIDLTSANVFTSSSAAAPSSNLTLKAAGDIAFGGGSGLGSIASGGGNSGAISIEAGGAFRFGQGEDATSPRSAIVTRARNGGLAGALSVVARSGEISESDIATENFSLVLAEASLTDSGWIDFAIAEDLTLTRSTIGANTLGANQAGDVAFGIGGTLTMRGAAIGSTAGDVANAEEMSPGSAGDIVIEAGSIDMLSGFENGLVRIKEADANREVPSEGRIARDDNLVSAIQSNAFGTGDSGDIRVTVNGGRLLMRSFNPENPENFEENGQPNEEVDQFIVGTQSIVGSTTRISSVSANPQSGSAGRIDIDVTPAENGGEDSGALRIEAQSSIAANTESDRPAVDEDNGSPPTGGITINARRVSIDQFGQGITSFTRGLADASDIAITANRVEILGRQDNFADRVSGRDRVNDRDRMVGSEPGDANVFEGIITSSFFNDSSTLEDLERARALGGDAGDITLAVNELVMDNRSRLTSTTRTGGDAGALAIHGMQGEDSRADLIRLEMTRADLDLADAGNDFGATTTIRAAVFNNARFLEEDGEITRVPEAGTISLRAETLSMTNSTISNQVDTQENPDGRAPTPEQFRAVADRGTPSIRIDAGEITLANSSVSSTTRGAARAGDITVHADRALTITGANPDEITAAELLTLSNGSSPVRGYPGAAGIFAAADDSNRTNGDRNVDASVRSGDAGNIQITAGSLSLSSEFEGLRSINSRRDPGRLNPGGAFISSSTERTGRAGDVSIVVAGLVSLDGDLVEIASSARTDLVERASNEIIDSGELPRFNNIGDAGNVSVVAGELRLNDRSAISSNAEAGADAGTVNVLVADFADATLAASAIEAFNAPFDGGESPVPFTFDTDMLEALTASGVENPGRVTLKGSSISSRTDVYNIPGTEYERFPVDIADSNNDFVIPNNRVDGEGAVLEPSAASLGLNGLDRFLGAELFRNGRVVGVKGLVPSGDAGSVRVTGDSLSLQRRDEDNRSGRGVQVSSVDTRSNGLGAAGDIHIRLSGRDSLEREEGGGDVALRLGPGQGRFDPPIADTRNTIRSISGSRAGGASGSIEIRIENGGMVVDDPAIISISNGSIGTGQFLANKQVAQILPNDRRPASERGTLSIDIMNGDVTLIDSEILANTSGVFDGGRIDLNIENGDFRMGPGSTLRTVSNVGTMPNFRGNQRTDRAFGGDDQSESRIGFSRALARQLEDPGDAGDIAINVPNGLLQLESDPGEGDERAVIASRAGLDSSGAAGRIDIVTRGLSMQPRTRIIADTNTDVVQSVDGDGTASVDINVLGEAPVLLDRGEISAATSGTQSGGSVDLWARGDIVIANRSEVSSATFSETSNAADAGTVRIISDQGDITVNGGSVVTTSSSGNASGAASRVVVHAEQGAVTVDGAGSQIASQAGIMSAGAGRVFVDAARVAVTDGGQITASTQSGFDFREGRGPGSVLIEVSGVGGAMGPESDAGDNAGAGQPAFRLDGAGSQISAESSSIFQDAGNVVVLIAKGDAAIANGGEITSASSDGGDAGTVVVDVQSGALSIGGAGSGASSQFTGTSQHAGAVLIKADGVRIADGAVVTASTTSDNLQNVTAQFEGLESGTVIVFSTSDITIDNASVTSQTSNSQDAGRLEVTAVTGDITIRDGAQVTSSSTLNQGDAPSTDAGDGGSVQLTAVAGDVLVRGGSLVSSDILFDIDDDNAENARFVQAFLDNQARLGNGGDLPQAGNVSIFGENVRVEDGSTIQTSGRAGVAGSIIIGVDRASDPGNADTAPANASTSALVKVIDSQGGPVQIALVGVEPGAQGAETVIVSGSTISSNGSFPAARSEGATGRLAGDPIRVNGDFVVIQDQANVSSIVEVAQDGKRRQFTALDALPEGLGLAFDTSDFVITFNAADSSLIDDGSRVVGAGEVRILGAEENVGNQLQLDEGVLVNIDGLLRRACAARDVEGESSFTVRGTMRGILTPDQPLSGLTLEAVEALAAIDGRDIVLASACGGAGTGKL